jgi:hypothetical protein
MLEIIIIWRLTKYIGTLAQEKGYKKLGYQVMSVILWLVGELIGGSIAYSFFEKKPVILQYVIAFIGALAGAGIAFLIMRALPNHETDIPSEKPKFSAKKFIPLIVSFLAIGCLCISFGGLVFYRVITLADFKATELSIDTQIANNDQISHLKEFSVKANIIYFTFYLDCPEDMEVPIEIRWYINEDPVFASTGTHRKGYVITTLERAGDLHMAQFPPGTYRAEVWFGKKFLNSIIVESR